MEHRKGSRKEICLGVFLHLGDKCLGRYETRNLSAGGLSLKGSVRELANNSLVYVSLEQRLETDPASSVFKALVIHQTFNRIGLMWAGVNPSNVDKTPESKSDHKLKNGLIFG